MPLFHPKEDGQLFLRLFGLAAKIGKIKLSLASAKREKARQLRAIGANIQALYEEQGTLIDQPLMEHVAEELENLGNIERTLENGSAEIKKLQEEFRNKSGGKEPPGEDDDPPAK